MSNSDLNNFSLSNVLDDLSLKSEQTISYSV